MNNPIIPLAPVNNTITIQPLTTAVPQQGTSATPNPLANLANGTTVEGFVINRDSQGNPILRTPVGDLAINSEVFLKTGSIVVFRVDATQTSRARIVTVDGLSLQDYSTQNTRAVTADSIAAPTFRGVPILQPAIAPTGATAALSQPVLQALVLNPLNALLANAQKSVILSPIEQDNVPAALRNLPAGTALKLIVLDLELPPLPVSISSIPEPTLPATLLPQIPSQTKRAEEVKTQSVPPPLADDQPTASSAQSANTTIKQLFKSSSGAVTQATGDVVTDPTSEPIVTTTAAAPSAVISTKAAATSLPEPNLPEEANFIQTKSFAPPLNSEAAPVSPSTPNTIARNAVPPFETMVKSTVYAPPATSLNQLPIADVPLHAAVIGHEADGANILHTKFATLKLYTAQLLPTGTSLTLKAEVIESTNLPLLTPLSSELQTITSLTRDWQHLGDALNILQTQDPALTREVLQHMPNLGPKLSSGLLFFMAAVKAGDVGDWLGKNTVSRLKAFAPDLIKRLDSDMAQMQQFYINSPLTQWSGIMLPMLFGHELQQARLYIRKDDEANKNKSPNDCGQRFIIEIDTSHLGDLQFDGFVRSFEKNKAFDLVIRSSKPLNSEVSQGIRDVFENALQLTGLKGQLAFQQGVQHFVRPLASEQQPSSGDSAHTILA